VETTDLITRYLTEIELGNERLVVLGGLSPAIRYSSDRKIGGCRCCQAYKQWFCTLQPQK